MADVVVLIPCLWNTYLRASHHALCALLGQEGPTLFILHAMQIMALVVLLSVCMKKKTLVKGVELKPLKFIHAVLFAVSSSCVLCFSSLVFGVVTKQKQLLKAAICFCLKVASSLAKKQQTCQANNNNTNTVGTDKS